MTLAAVIQAAAAVIGFVYVIRSLRGATQDKLYAHYTEICKLFMQNPDLRPYFYQPEANSPGLAMSAQTERSMQDVASVNSPDSVTSAQPERSKQDMASKVVFMCEAILGLVEHAVLQRNNLPRDSWKRCWRPYAVERLKQSEALREFFVPNAHWYSKQMCDEMESIKKEVRKTDVQWK